MIEHTQEVPMTMGLEFVLGFVCCLSFVTALAVMRETDRIAAGNGGNDE